MSFTIEALQHDDLDEFIKVWWDAFAPESVDQVLPQIYPDGLTPELNERLRKRIFADTDGDLEEFCFIARDNATGRIAGIAWWSTLVKPTPPEDEAAMKAGLEKQLASKNVGSVPNTNQELGDAFFTAMYYAERETIKAKNVPYITLVLIGVLPEYGRKGIGSQLLQKGLDRVDKLNVWTFLIAGSVGKGLYEKHGFEAVKRLDVDATKYGGRSEGKHWVMWRPAQNQST